ncbi:MAG: hypothetical protein EBR86_08795 [Planctomycetia bacterium]|nr:hypothetical protein [Planctomycetia bacterium]
MAVVAFLGALLGPGAPVTSGGWSSAKPVGERMEMQLGSGLTARAFAWLGFKPPVGSTGMVPVEVQLINSGATAADVTLAAAAPEQRTMFGLDGMLPTTTVTVPAGATVATRLLADPWQNASMLERPLVALRAEPRGVSITLEPIFAAAAPPEGSGALVAITPAVDGCPGAGAADLGSPWALVDRGDCPDDWRSWTLLDRFALTTEDWQALPEGTREAIRQWVALGGRLTVFGTEASCAGLPATGLLGIGRIDFRSTADGALLGGAPATDRGGRDGVAPAAILGSYGFSGAGSGTSDTFSQPWPGRFQSLANHFGPRGLPVVALLVFVTLLAMIAGPLNVMVFAGRGRRARLFWTTPAITLAATAMLLCFMVFRDGVGGRGVRRVLCVLVPEHNALTVLQEQFTRTGILVGSGFAQGETSWMRPVGGIQPGSLCVEHGDGRRTGDWFRSRADRGHVLFAVRPSRSRVEVVATADDGAPTLVSSIDMALETLLFRDRADRLWHAANVTAGVRQVCTRAGEETLSTLVAKLSNDAGELRERALRRLALPPGHVIAVGRAADRFAIGTLESIRWEDEQVVVVGPVSAGAAP